MTSNLSDIATGSQDELEAERMSFPVEVGLTAGKWLVHAPPGPSLAFKAASDRSAASWRFGSVPLDFGSPLTFRVRKPIQFRFPDGVTVEPARWAVPGLSSLLRWRDRHPVITYPDLNELEVSPLFVPLSEASQCRRLVKSMRLMGLEPGRVFPEDTAFPIVGAQALADHTRVESQIKVAAVTHLHFPDVWPDLEAAFKLLPTNARVIVTATPEAAGLQERVRRTFPGSDFRVVDNVGRDVRPFLELLDGGDLDGFDAVLKVHGKKSMRHGRATYLGEAWRRMSLFDLAAAPGRLDEALAAFAADPHLGMLGPTRLRLPKNPDQLNVAWSDNRASVKLLCDSVGMDFAQFDLDFFAGTMFWVRPAALRMLRGHGLGEPGRYEQESGSLNGALEHGLERIIPAAVRAAGYQTRGLSPA